MRRWGTASLPAEACPLQGEAQALEETSLRLEALTLGVIPAGDAALFPCPLFVWGQECPRRPPLARVLSFVASPKLPCWAELRLRRWADRGGKGRAFMGGPPVEGQVVTLEGAGPLQGLETPCRPASPTD